MDKSGTSHLAKALQDSHGGVGDLVRGFRLRQWQVRPAFCELTDGVRTEHLEPKVMAVLLCLAQRAPDVVTRELFMTEVWGGRTVTDEVLSRSISLLRDHLGDDSSAPKFVRTIPRVGYALVAPVERVDARARGEGYAADRDRRAGQAAAASSAAPIHLAVIPFANLNLEPDTDYFVDGVADELAASLSRVDGIQVVARTSAQRFKDLAMDLREIGRQLGATHLVHGSGCSDGQRLHIGVQLTDAHTGQELWADSYDGGLEQVFAVQSDIASAIAQSLARTLPTAPPAGSRPPSWNLEAYQSYLRARQQLKRRGSTAIRSSIDLLEEAVALDPHLAAAHVALAYAYTLLPSYASVDAAVMYRSADLALAQASGDPGLAPEIFGVRAVLETRRNHWIAAEDAFQRALAANPAAAEVRQWYSQLLGAVGKLPDALRQASGALASDPLSPILNFRLAVCLLWNDHDADAERQFMVARELGLEPSVTPEAFVMLLIRQRRYDEVARALVEVQHGRWQSDAWVAAAVAAIRDGSSGPQVASDLERAFSSRQMSSLLYFGMLALTAHHELALQTLLARPEVSPSTLEFLFTRQAQETRRHPDFARLIRQLGVDAYWDRYGWPPMCSRTSGSLRCN
jgi:TolB-like protein